MSNILKFTNKYIKRHQMDIDALSDNLDFDQVNNFFKNNYNIDSQIDQDIIKPFTRDWSNLSGSADLLVRPKNDEECAIILLVCHKQKIPVTFSAGQTNLTGSATPHGGVIFSTSQLNKAYFSIDIDKKMVNVSVSMRLENMRNKILEQSNNTLYYPVDPTSRNDAFVGGTLSCNASGFIPGNKGATRYWVEEIEFILINGFSLSIKRGEYISKNGQFIIQCNKQKSIVQIPRYKRPDIKNASGPFSSQNSEIDFIDLIIGSEGIFGLITNCTLKLDNKPNAYLDLFLRLSDEKEAVEIHQFLNKELNQGLSNITALEYFGYNCQYYMKNREFLFNNKNEVGLYIQVPIYNGSVESKSEEWAALLSKFNPSFDLSTISILSDPSSWKKFFEARHSMPDNALIKTQKMGGVSIITDTIVPPEKFQEYLVKIHNRLQKSNIEYLLFGHLGDCHLHFHLIPNKKQEKISLEIYDYMVDLSSELGGVYSAEHGTGKRKRNDFKKCYGNEAVNMVKNTKLGFDPGLLLNRGNII